MCNNKGAIINLFYILGDIMKNETIILASSSPRRIEMMQSHDITPVIIKPECEEMLPAGIKGDDAVRFLSLKKALDVEKRIIALSKIPGNDNEAYMSYLDRGAYIIAADTVVYKDRIMGKPADKAEALEILMELSEEEHSVITGVSILQCGRPRRVSFAETTKVFFTKYSEDELYDYINTEEPYDKAGGYAIQGTFGKYIDHIEGDLNNVIGFPWDRIVKEFEMLTNNK